MLYWSNEVRLLRRRQKAAVNGKVCIAVGPSKGHQAVSFAITHGNMVKHPGSEFCLLAACPFEQTVINDKSIYPVIAC
jgi:hypothetical protein